MYYGGLLYQLFQICKDDHQGVEVMREDWHNLIVLDACRYDYFKKINWIKGKLRRKISLGSHTVDWIINNFQGKYPNTVYVSGNPQISELKCRERLGRNPFFKIEKVWDYGWSEKTGRVSEKEVTNAAVRIRKKYPEKRMIVHYMQPHWPFPPSFEVSKPNLRSKSRWLKGESLLWKITGKLADIFPVLSRDLRKRRKGKGTVWDYLGDGSIDVDKAKLGYVENLLIVLYEVEGLLEKLKTKTVITADHGNLFGEHNLYGHPRGMRFRELIEIPWLEVSK